jgi:hypothetical protein
VKKAALALCVFLLLTSCASYPRKTHIIWPDRIDYLAALCDLDMSWRDMKYSGSMSIKMWYPDRLHIEIYGPFGETVVYLLKDGDKFSFVSGDEKFNEQEKFEKRFGIRLNEFIDDIAIRNPLIGSSGEGNMMYIKRENYVVTYEFGENQDRICWKGKDGSICMRFLEATFNEN